MSRHKHKARGKVTQKLTRNGLVERNSATGAEERLSQRNTDFDIRGGKTDDRALSQAGVKADSPQSMKQRNRAAYKYQRQQDTQIADSVDVAEVKTHKQDAPLQFTTADEAKSETFEASDNLLQTEQKSLRQERGIPQIPFDTPKDVTPPTAEVKLRELASDSAVVHIEHTPPKLKTEHESKLQTVSDNRLRFKRDEILPQGQSKRPKPNYSKSKFTVTESEQPQTVVPPQIIPVLPITPKTDKPKMDAPQSSLQFVKREKLHFTDSVADSTPESFKLNQQQQYAPPENEHSLQDTDVTNGDTSPITPKSSEQSVRESVHESGISVIDNIAKPKPSQSPLKEQESALKPERDSKLKFKPGDTPPEVVKPSRKLQKAQKQADKSVEKLESAKSNLPAKKKLRLKTVVNAETGKPKHKLYFEKEVKSQAEHMKGAKPLRPVKAIMNSALMFGHTKMFQVEHENVSVKAAHKAEMLAEGGVRIALRRHKAAPYRKVEKLQRTAQKKSVNLSYQKALAENPKLKSNMLSRAFQKRKIKKDYAKAARQAQKAVKKAKKAGSIAGNATKAVVGVIKRHPVAAAAVILVVLLLFCLMSLIGTFGSLGSGGLGGILTASYLAEDADIESSELVYTEWEVSLQEQIANVQTTHSGYDEYRYHVGDISHNPYELMAYLTVKYQNFNYAAIQADLQALFAEQYTLTFTPSVETRYTTPSDPYDEPEPYDWTVLTVTLTARNFTEIIASRLNGEELAHYAVLLQTKGARQTLANPFGDLNWLPSVTSYYGYRIHPISGTKDLHRGIDIGMPLGTEIKAGQNGTVTYAGWDNGYGYYVVIDDGKGLVSKYAHCNSLNVSTGQTVSIGDVIGKVGSTGSSTGNHLHLEIMKNGSYVNPIFYADTGSFNLTPSYGFAGAPMGDGSYAALMQTALLFEGYPYVWGGSSPSTSFDCSGLVSYVLRASGVKDVGRLTAQGLYNISTPVLPSEAMPGDLVFFHSTYSSPNPITHVAIYCGGNLIYHAGNPIGYAYIDTPYWQSHFAGFGRVTD